MDHTGHAAKKHTNLQKKKKVFLRMMKNYISISLAHTGYCIHTFAVYQLGFILFQVSKVQQRYQVNYQPIQL